MCLICLIWGRSRYEMTGFLWDTPVRLRGYADGRVAGSQHLGSRAGICLQGVFGQPLLAAVRRVFLLIAFQNHMSNLEGKGRRCQPADVSGHGLSIVACGRLGVP